MLGDGELLVTSSSATLNMPGRRQPSERRLRSHSNITGKVTADGGGRDLSTLPHHHSGFINIRRSLTAKTISSLFRPSTKERHSDATTGAAAAGVITTDDDGYEKPLSSSSEAAAAVALSHAVASAEPIYDEICDEVVSSLLLLPLPR